MKKRLLSLLLAASLVFGTAAALPDGAFCESASITASAEVSGDYEYTKLEDGTIQIDSYKGSAATVKIPSSLNKMKVTKLGNSAFSNNSTITSVTIPDTVKQIGNYTFYGCLELKSVTFPSSLTAIGNNAFSSCSKLASITLPSKLKTIGYGSFNGCRALKKLIIPDSVTTIEDSAFCYCSGLTSVKIGKSVKSIGKNAFYSCSNLASISFPSSLKKIGYNAFDWTQWIKDQRKKNPLVVVNGILIDAQNATGKVKIPSTVTSIAGASFSDNRNVTSISIPKTVTSIDEPIFYDCTALTSINVDSGNTKYSSENGILYNKKKTKLIKCPQSKKNVTIPSTVTEICISAFCGNVNLQSVTFPKSLKKICNAAFKQCTSLKSAVLPKGLTTIEEHAFKDCSLLEKVTIPEGVTTIRGDAFYGCTRLKSVTVPKSVTYIGGSAFGKWHDYSQYKECKVEGFVLRCYVGTEAEEYAAREGLEYKLIDSKVPDGFEKSGAKKISETPFKQFSAYDLGFGIYANAKNNGLYVINKSVLYFISASTGKTSKVYDFSSLVSDSINNSYVCGNKLYAVGSHYQNEIYLYSIYIYNLDTKKLVKRMSTKIEARAVAANTKGNIFVSDGSTIYMLTSAGKKLSDVSVGEKYVCRFTGYDETNGNLYFEGYNNYYYGSNALYSANVKNNKLSFTSKYINLHYQRYFFDHNNSSDLIDGKYLISTNNYVNYIDSNKLDLKKDSVPSLLSVTRPQLENGESGVDTKSYGVRAQYVKGTDSFVFYGNANTLYEYDKKANQLSTFKTLTHVFSMNKIGNNIIAVEQHDSKSFYLEVIPWKRATKVTITAPSKSTVVGKTIKLSAKTDSVINETLTWSSSNTKVATVSSDGKVYATGVGTATITVKTNNGVKSSVKITVKANSALVSPVIKTASKGAKSTNASAQDYTVWSDVNNSYIYEDKDQNIWRAEYIGSKIKVEKYSQGAKKLLKTYTISPELPIFGGVYFSSDYNYVVTGQQNPKYSDSVEVMRITRYTKDWKKKDHVSIKGANTYVPFRAGSCRMIETSGKLYIHTCHLMYASGDGLNHQANMTFVVNKSKMKVVDSYYNVMNIAQAGYVSHSFNQFIKTDGKEVFRVDHGDAYPRGISITAFKVSSKVSDIRYTIPVPIDGATGQNYTGVSVGGFELSKNSCIVAYTKDINSDTNHRNIYVSITDKLFNKTKEVKLTSFTKDSNVRASTPQLVKVSDYLFVVMWEERDFNKDTTSTKLLLIDGSGKKCSAEGTVKGRLSDCQPIKCKDGCIRWYSTNGTSPTFYAVQPFEIGNMHDHKYANPKITKKATCTQNGTRVLTCTICGKKKTETIKATGHKWSAWKTTSSDKSKNTYTQTRKCSACGKTQTQSVQRFAGANRYDTARLISKGSYPSGTDTVIVATGLDFHDALVAVPLASAYNAPLLLATDKLVTKQTEAELKRLKAKKVIIVSTNGAVGIKVKAALAKYNPTVIGGKNCFETASKVAKALQNKTKKAPDTIFFATDSAFADALSASPVAAIKNAPIIYLKKSGSIDSATAAYLKSVKGKVKNAYIIGGDGVISNAMMKNVATALGLTVNKNVVRVAGKNRYETCVAVNNKFKSLLKTDGICIAKGLDFPDALAGGVYAAKNRQALFLADGKKLLDCQKTYLKSKNASKITVFGGTGAVPDSLVKLIADARG